VPARTAAMKPAISSGFMKPNGQTSHVRTRAPGTSSGLGSVLKRDHSDDRSGRTVGALRMDRATRPRLRPILAKVVLGGKDMGPSAYQGLPTADVATDGLEVGLEGMQPVGTHDATDQVIDLGYELPCDREHLVATVRRQDEPGPPCPQLLPAATSQARTGEISRPSLRRLTLCPPCRRHCCGRLEHRPAPPPRRSGLAHRILRPGLPSPRRSAAPRAPPCRDG
jgi:hypothetical protein